MLGRQVTAAVHQGPDMVHQGGVHHLLAVFSLLQQLLPGKTAQIALRQQLLPGLPGRPVTPGSQIRRRLGCLRPQRLHAVELVAQTADALADVGQVFQL